MPGTLDDEAFRAEIRGWLEANLVGDFAQLRGAGGPGAEHEHYEGRLAWERHLAANGWNCVGFPKEHGGRGLSLAHQVIYHEEYARSRAPARVGIVGEGLLGPTLIAFGTPEQQRRFLPGIVNATELWCQGYSEPNAGSDLANVQTRAERDGDEWVVSGQKVWTSLAQWADWCFVVCRTDREQPRHRGLSYLLVPMRQPGIEIRPIVQITGTSEFNEVFFDGARTPAENVIGDVNGGWRVAMGTLAFERGVSTLGQQLNFKSELDRIVAAAQANGRAREPVVRQAIARSWGELEIMRLNALRTLARMDDNALSREGMITKLYWASVHRRLGELAVDVLGADAMIAGAAAVTDERYPIDDAQRLFLWTRADTIYGGSNQIQRNQIGERALGLPPEPKVVKT